MKELWILELFGLEFIQVGMSCRATQGVWSSPAPLCPVQLLADAHPGEAAGDGSGTRMCSTSLKGLPQFLPPGCDLA